MNVKKTNLMFEDRRSQCLPFAHAGADMERIDDLLDIIVSSLSVILCLKKKHAERAQQYGHHFNVAV